MKMTPNRYGILIEIYEDTRAYKSFDVRDRFEIDLLIFKGYVKKIEHLDGEIFVFLTTKGLRYVEGNGGVK